METAKLLDFDGVKVVRKRRTFSSRKPRSGGSYTLFLNEQNHSSAWASPPSDPQNIENSDKGLNDTTGKYLNCYSHGDEYNERLGNSNSMERFEMGKDDLGRSLKSGYKMASGDDDSVPERDEIKRVPREFVDLNGKHLGSSPDDDRDYDRGGSKSQDNEHSRISGKSYREKSLEESKEYSTGEKVERERSRFSKAFKRKCNSNYLHRSKRFHEGEVERKDSYERHGSHERLEHDCDRDRDKDRYRSLDVHGSMESGKGGLGHSHKPEVVVGLGAAGTSSDWCSSDGYKVLERSLDSHNPSHSKLDSEGPNGGQVKTATDGKTSDSRDPDTEALVKSLLQQDDLPSEEVRLTKLRVKIGGETHTVHANSTCNAGGIKKMGSEGSSVSAKPPHAAEGRRQRRLILQEDLDDEDSVPVRVEIQEASERKEKLLEVEQQLKKTEASERRKMQLEKAANAAQAEAIRKILGKDSSRKKRGDKLQKQRDAIAKKKAASAMLLSSNGVRWVMGPSGTVVSFSENKGLPSIFNNTRRYPSPREKCAGPLCNNTYKYRDSGTNLPLCSLQCYRTIHDV